MDKPSKRSHLRSYRFAGSRLSCTALCLVATAWGCGGPAVTFGEHRSDGIVTPTLACGPTESLGSEPAPGDPVTLTINNNSGAVREVWRVAADGSSDVLGEVANGQALTAKVQRNTVLVVKAGGRCVVATRAAAGNNHFSVQD